MMKWLLLSPIRFLGGMCVRAVHRLRCAIIRIPPLQNTIHESVLAHIPGFMWSTRVKSTSQTIDCTHTLFISDSCDTVTGRAYAALKSHPNLLKILTIPEDQHKVDAAFTELHQNKKADFRHRVINAQTGEVKHVESRMVAAVSKSGEINRVDGITLDFTDVVSLEEQIKILQLNLIQMTSMHRKARDHEPTQDEFTPTTINLPSIIEDCLARLRPFFESKNIKLAASTLSPNLQVKGHRRQLEEVFMCVLLNAIDAVEKLSSSTITVKIEQEGSHGVITVTDTGVGIQKEFQTKVFDPFFTTKAIVNSDRIGLSISQLTIQQHGGEITFESTPSKGSSFFIRIPHCNNSLKTESSLNCDLASVHPLNIKIQETLPVTHMTPT